MKSCMMMCALLGMCLGMASAVRVLAATSTSTATLTLSGAGSGYASADCSAKDGWTANCVSDGTAAHGNKVAAVSKGDARQGDVNAEAIGVALKKSDSRVLAKAVADGAGDVLALAIADGVKAGGHRKTTVVTAIAKVITEKGCPSVEPALAIAFAKANEGGYLRTFVDAFDVDVVIAKCLYPKCIDDRWHCCKDSSDWRCAKKGYGTFKTTPQAVYSCSGCKVTHCMCY